MENDSNSRTTFEADVIGRFGILPNFFRSARAAPELLEQLWGFAKAGYLDNPMPSLFKERLFVWLSRFCPVRYCIVRHVGFLLGREHGRAAGDAGADAQSTEEVLALLRRPSPWKRDMALVYANLESTSGKTALWPVPGSRIEDEIFACAAVMFVEPARSESARRALSCALGLREFEFLCGCLAFVRTAHYWTMLHPEIESEEDMIEVMRGHEELAQLLLEDPEANRSELSERMFSELTHLRELNERQELQKAKQALEEKDRQKDQFIAVLAHELRNPLAAIRTAAYALRRLNLQDDRAGPLVERVDRQTTAIARMLEDLLDASRIAFGKVSVQLEVLDLRGLLTDALDEHAQHARQAGLQLIRRIGNDPCIVNADRVRLRQIIDNLLSNAIKFTPTGGSVELTLAARNESAVVSIRDTGIGFESTFAEKLFEPFVQHEQGRDRSAGGLGLGLAIAALLARLQNGSLTATSTGVGHGATFTLSVPMARPLDAGPIDSNSVEQFSQRSVLLVEDNRDLADGIAELLRLHGVVVRVAYDGPAAIKSALEAVPDIILCDLGLPGGMDGFAVARACRVEAALRNVRLVAASGYSSAEDHANAMQAGFDSLMVKPITEESLRTLVG
ncbi:MAG TPA: hybrid sensor histidine kinase/response regulator [Steroidobacteraceae bacterium]|jgi:signal transduction histidine kinase/CheY-like chemotaxis protein|nr:hybrid sensor histidine kinase/response regulator [Steroidobacteraceae bacterium]